MARARQPVSIDGVEFDALIEETRSYESEIPTYPVEDGFEVSDSIILKPLSLSMTLFLTNTPVTWRGRHGVGPHRVLDVVQQLEDLYFTKMPVTVSTTDKTYKSMAITSMELTKSTETGSSRDISIQFQEIRVVAGETTDIPDSYGKGGKTGKNAGTANTKRRSIPAVSSDSASGTGMGGGNDSGENQHSILFGMAYGGSESAANKYSLAKSAGLIKSFGGD